MSYFELADALVVPTYPLLAPDGTAVAPSYSFTNATGTGLYLFAANSLGFATNGVAVGSISSAGAWAIGPESTDLLHEIYGSIRLGNQAATSNPYITTKRNDGSLTICGDNSNTGTQIVVVGKTHATLPNQTLFYNYSGSALVQTGGISQAGSWTIGPPTGAGGSAHHIRNADTGAALGSHLELSAGSAAGLPYNITRDRNDGSLNLTGASGASTGGMISLFGSTHASLPNWIRFVQGGVNTGWSDNNGAWTIGQSGGTQSHSINGNNTNLFGSINGGQVYFGIRNANAAASSDAKLYIETNGAAAGDPFIHFNNSVSNWAIGMDNSASDAFSVSASTTLGSTEYLNISTAGAISMGASGQTHTITGSITNHTGLVGHIQSTNNVTDALPTQAEMVTAFGAANQGNGLMGVIKDANADTNFFICISNGTSWYALKMTKGA